MDEITEAKIDRYFIDDVTADEEALIRKAKQGYVSVK